MRLSREGGGEHFKGWCLELLLHLVAAKSQLIIRQKSPNDSYYYKRILRRITKNLNDAQEYTVKTLEIRHKKVKIRGSSGLKCHVFSPVES